MHLSFVSAVAVAQVVEYQAVVQEGTMSNRNGYADSAIIHRQLLFIVVSQSSLRP